MDKKTIDLQNRIINHMKSNLPISVNGKVFDIEDLTFAPPSELNSIDAQLNMRYSGKDDMKGWVKGRIVITDQTTGQVVSKSPQMVKLVPVYAVTDRGTYMVNGVDKTIISSMRLKPGVYTSRAASSPTVSTDFRFDRSDKTAYVPGIKFTFNPINSDFTATIGGSTSGVNFKGVNLLRELGFSDQEIVRAIGNDKISDSIMSGAKNTKSIGDIYKAVTGKVSKEGSDNTRAALLEYLSMNASFGGASDNLESTIGIKSDTLSKGVILNAIQKMFSVVRLETEEDIKDDLRFQDVLDDNDLMMEEFEQDFEDLKKNARETMNSQKKTNLSYTDFSKAVHLNNRLDAFMKGTADQLSGKSSLVHASEQINPLFMASIGKQVSQIGGTGGLTADTKRNALSAANLKGMGFNRLDPVETPESGSVGLVERLTQSSVIRDKTIYAPVLKVFGKEVTDSKSNTVELSPTEEYNAKVAFFDSKFVERKGNKIVFTSNTVPGRYKGKTGMFPVSEIQYIDNAAQNVFSYSANLIPFVNHDDGNRVLMGTSMQRDAMVLKNRELALVTSSVDGTNNTYEKLVGEEYGKPVRSATDGSVTNISDTEITVKDDSGKAFIYPYYKHFKAGQGSVNNELLVKQGDKVKAGQMLAEGWQTRDGELALGVNARTGFLSYKGQNYEDGIVISRSFADKMVTEEVNEFEVDIPEDAIGGIGSGAKAKFRDKTTEDSILTRLDSDGVIRVGETLKPGDTVAAFLVPSKKKDSGLDELLGHITKSQGDYELRRKSIPSTSYLGGTVERVNKVESPGSGIKQKIIITIISEKSMVLGDKLSGKHGNKGTITKILDDDEMPVSSDGKALDVIFSPLAVPSRKNVGQIYEVGAGIIAEKKGTRIIVNNFDKDEKTKVIDGLKEIGMADGKMFVTLKERQDDGSIKDVRTENKVTVGNMYVMKLNKKSEDKIQARSNYEGSKPPENVTYMPNKNIGEVSGGKHNPQSFGEMEMRALQAHGAVYNILESSTVKADGGGDASTRMAIFEALKTGNISELDMPATPQSLKVTADAIAGMGLNLQPLYRNKKAKSFDDIFDSLSLVPMKNSEFLKTVGKENEVTEYTPMKAKVTFNDIPTPGGAVDPAIFGEKGTLESRTKWGYIKLATPMPNPILFKSAEFNPYSTLTGISKVKLESLITGGNVLIIDPDKYDGAMLNGPDKAVRVKEFKDSMNAAGLKPGDMVPSGRMNALIQEHGEILWKAGGEGLSFMLDNIDVKKEMAITKKLLNNASGTDIDKYYKKYKMLDTLKKNDMQASDLMMDYVPVTPVYMRQIVQVNDQSMAADVTVLYNNLIKANKPIKEIVSNGYDMVSDTNPESASRITGNLYSKLGNIMGTDQFIDRKKKTKYKGFKQMIDGKDGLIRGKLLKKGVDFSGRAVIGVDPSLELNQVGIPIDMAVTMYKPFIYRELIESGYAGNMDEAKSKLEQKDIHVRRVLDKIVKDRPVLMNRQPSLHAQAIQAMTPVIRDTQDGDVVRSIQLNPLVVTAYNADFDGDQMAVHVPITEKAKEEAKKIMMPTENMISNTNGDMIFKIRQEMVMGIYYLTKDADKPKGKNIQYNSWSQLRKDYVNGKISTTQNVSIMGLSNVTAGYALFILLIPAEYRSGVSHPISKPWDSKDINALITKMSDDCESTNGKKISRIEIANIMDRLKTLGFDASTKSGLSIGLNDFEKIEDVEKLYGKALDEVTDEDNLRYHSPLAAAGVSVEKTIESKLKSGKAMRADNPVNMIMMSGARGNAAQYKKIMGTVGIGVDITGKMTDPVKSSFMDGLSPDEYWTLGSDSRKGIYDRSVAASAPGAFTREVWSTSQDMVITEKDCGSKDGILITKSSNTLIGRILLEDLVTAKGVVLARKGEMITKAMHNKIYKDDSVTDIRVRTPLKCKTIHGICRKCYGASPGTVTLPQLGTAVGVIASQSFGEPFTQGTLNTFHTGGANSFASAGLPRVKQILDLTQDKLNSAALADVSGIVTRIDRGMRGTFDVVYINSKAHKIPHVNGEPAKLKVNEGDTVSKGDFLTVGDSKDIINKVDGITNVAPKRYFDLRSSEFGSEQAKEETQDLLLNTFSSAVTQSLGSPNAIDQRHLEVVLSKMTGRVKVVDGGGSDYIKGDVIERNVVDKWNLDNQKYRSGLEPIVFENILLSKGTSSYKGDDNFFSALGTQNVGRHLARGATMGPIDKLDDPRGRLMTGKLLNIGKGFGVPREIADSISSRMKNIFAKD